MIPPGWKPTTLGAIASAPYGLVDGPFGSNLPASAYVPTGIPVVRGSNLSLGTRRFLDEGFVWVSESTAAKLSRSICRPGDIVFTKKGTLGQTGFIPASALFDEYLLSSNQMKLTVDRSAADPLYVYYYVSAPQTREKIIQDASVTGVPKTNVAYLRDFPIVLPPLPTQRRIAAILSAYDDLIENNNRRIKVLEEMAQRIYREWFVEFRYPGHEDIPLMESELGPMPPGWSVAALSALSTITMGQSPPSSAYNRDGVGLPFHQGVGTYGTHFPVHEVFSTAGTRTADDGDVLMSVRAPVGRINVADRHMILGRGLCGIRADTAPAEFLLHALKHVFREEDVMGSGAIFMSVTKRDVEGLQLACPGAALAARFSGTVKPMWTLLRLLTRAAANLRSNRDLMLPRLLSGELDVADLDIAVTDRAA